MAALAYEDFQPGFFDEAPHYAHDHDRAPVTRVEIDRIAHIFSSRAVSETFRQGLNMDREISSLLMTKDPSFIFTNEDPIHLVRRLREAGAGVTVRYPGENLRPIPALDILALVSREEANELDEASRPGCQKPDQAARLILK